MLSTFGDSILISTRVIVSLSLVVGGFVLFGLGFILILKRVKATFETKLDRDSIGLSLRSNSPGLLFVALGTLLFWVAADMRVIERETKQGARTTTLTPPAAPQPVQPATPGRPAPESPASPPSPTTAPSSASGRSAAPARQADTSGLNRIEETWSGTVERQYVDGQPLSMARVREAIDVALAALDAERTALRASGGGRIAEARTRNAIETLGRLKEELERRNAR